MNPLGAGLQSQELLKERQLGGKGTAKEEIRG